ncbi:MAG: SGNH/GDSL hydrolase family protein [Ferruginibacter sp.]
MTHFTYLALGDSYTIGEQVLLQESFPCQVVQLLRQNKTMKNSGSETSFTAPEIIAKTGWTTDELTSAIEKNTLLPQYDFVSLLIGVNNQYRGRSLHEFETGFTYLLQMAIQFAANQAKKVFVLSIPDWGITPFAEARLPDGQGRDSKKIAGEIDAFNEVCKKVSALHNCIYIDITASQRADGNNAEFLAADGLHPSAKEYAKWARLLSEAMMAA